MPTPEPLRRPAAGVIDEKNFDFNTWRLALDAPAPAALADWPEFVHPHRPIDLPEWETPEADDATSLATLRDRLSWDAWRVCLWTAAEQAAVVFADYAWLVDDNWHEAPAGDPTWGTAARGVAAQAAAVLWRDAPPTALYDAALAFFAIPQERMPRPARYAWYAIRNALHGWTGGVRHFAYACLAADVHEGRPPTDTRAALAGWWRRCRCRLAFADAARVRLSSASRIDCQSVVTRAVAGSGSARQEASGLVLHWVSRAGDGSGVADSPDGPPMPREWSIGLASPRETA